MPDLEFHVAQQGVHYTTNIFRTFKEAEVQVERILSDPTVKSVVIDVVTWTREAAVEYAGEHGGEVYDEDPEASVHDRIQCSRATNGMLLCMSTGRVP
jgi:hypothetical protein